MFVISFSLLTISVNLASAKSFRVGTDDVLTEDQAAQETSTLYVVIPPSTVVQDTAKRDGALHFLEKKPGTSTEAYPGSNMTYPNANYTSRALGGRLFGDRPSSDSEDKDKMSVELSFVFPFLDVPLGSKGSLGRQSTSTASTTEEINTDTGGLTNGMNRLLALDPKSVAHAFFLSMGTVVLIPFVTSILTGTPATSVKRSEESVHRVLAQLDRKLQSYNIDASSCVSKAICTYVRVANKKMLDGRAESSEQIIDGIAKNRYVKSLVSGTSIAEAIEAGRKPGRTCIDTYPKCPFTVSAMSSFLTSFLSQMVAAPS